MKIIWFSTILLLFAGLVAALTGIWFIVGDFPFDSETGFSDKMNISKDDLVVFNPKILSWVIHTTDQVGSVSMGWGLFVIALAWFGVRKLKKFAWYALWIGGTPTLLISTLKEIMRYGILDTGSILNMVVFLLFIIGMLLPIKSFMPTKNEVKVSI